MSVCSGQARACLIRVAVLDSDGAPDPGPGNLYVSSGLISMQWTDVVTTGTAITVDDGCGQRCVNLPGAVNRDRLDLTLTLCGPEPELLHILSGGTIHALASETTGYGLPGTGSLSANPDVSIELWEGIVVSDSIVGYARHVFSKTRDWRLNGGTFGNSALDVVLSGVAIDAGEWGEGPGDDWSDLSDEDVTLYDWALEVNELPEANCGAQELVLA